MNERFEIEGLAGEQTLSGTISVYGSKNESLLALSAVLVFEDEITLSNVPAIADVECMVNLLRDIGATVNEKEKGVYSITPPKNAPVELNKDIVGKIRASVFFAVVMLARYGHVRLPYPGGDSIGPRPIDQFISGLKKMGAECVATGSHYEFKAPSGGLRGADIFLKMQSVGATQSLMLAAILAQGTTTIKNVALEPEIIHCATFLKVCGAKIEGIGTTTLTITGGGLLRAATKTYTIIPDRLETGTFLVLGVLAGKDITIQNADASHVEALITLLNETTSTEIVVEKNVIRVQNKVPLVIQPSDVRTHEYPGFASDLQPPLVVLLTQAEGKSLVFETLYEERFNYVGNLIQMGATIKTYDPHRISVRGKTALRGAVHTGPDIRAGLAYVLSAIIAKGHSVIHNVYVIDRGYERIEERLTPLGIAIKRVTT
jgi:UDP-N-acetylglucosamine 1-carboxyvinyltransferase